jgi:hypothetical protein
LSHPAKEMKLYNARDVKVMDIPKLIVLNLTTASNVDYRMILEPAKKHELLPPLVPYAMETIRPTTKAVQYIKT